jgi:D-alanyl-D-alanine-carboxypeptidase/D-alanyl-D-alanine-endopeptidase
VLRRPIPVAGWQVAALLLCTPPVAAQSGFLPDSAVQAVLRDVVASERAVGIVAGLLDADGTRRFFSAGSSGIEGRPLDGHSVFEIGSITKAFTATLLADMVLRREVKLSDPVDKFLPSRVSVPSRGDKRITLLDLATHYSGLPYVPTNIAPADPANPYADYPPDSLYAFLARYELPRDPGAAYEYSNLGIGLLGHALAARVGLTYEELLRRRVLAPLGMRETGVELAPTVQAHLTSGHNEFGEPVPPWEWQSLHGAGALRSTAVDLLQFAAANLPSESGPLARSTKLAHVPRRLVLSEDGSPSSDSVGLAWVTSHGPAGTLTFHGGGTGGYRTFVVLDPGARRAVVVLANSGGERVGDVGFHLLRPALSVDPLPVELEVVKAYRARGVAAAVARYRQLRRAAEPRRKFDQDQLNTVGYWLFGQGRLRDAAAIFRLNVEMYPDESNPYDSLGEALLALGDTLAAIRNYQRSVDLDPGNVGGAAVLRRLRAHQPE